MQPAEEDSLIDDLKPITVKSKTRQVTAEDERAWGELTREQVAPWPHEAWVEEVIVQEMEWAEYIGEAI
jgi:hypothetical protein